MTFVVAVVVILILIFIIIIIGGGGCDVSSGQVLKNCVVFLCNMNILFIQTCSFLYEVCKYRVSVFVLTGCFISFFSFFFLFFHSTFSMI